MNESISHIIYKKLRRTPLTPEEEQALQEWLHASEPNSRLYKELYDKETLEAMITKRLEAEAREEAAFRVFEERVMQPGRTPVREMRTWPRMVAAAVLLAAIASGVFYRYADTPEKSIAAAAEHSPVLHDVPAGREGAILTLADGKKLVLDSMTDGVVASQNGTQLVLKDGWLSYNASEANAISYNIISTPKGRQCRLLLPDGSKVWLNAASSITYPTAFKGKERMVSVTGEAYLEVTTNARMPFRVTINDQTRIEVLGTQFNVNAYPDEKSIQTTLVEGSVRMVASRALQTLQPGQQAQVTGTGITLVENADIGQVTAWKNGFFNFENAGLKEVMHQLERWYDVEIVYENGIPPMQFGGEISRSISLAGLLKGLEAAGVHFRLEEGRRLVVMP